MRPARRSTRFRLALSAGTRAGLLLGLAACDSAFFAGVAPADAGWPDAGLARRCPELELSNLLPPRALSVSAMVRAGAEATLSPRQGNLPRTATTASFLAVGEAGVRTTSIALPDLVAYSAYRADDGALWVAGGTAAARGRVDVVHPDGRITTSTRTARPLAFITGPRGAGAERWAHEHPSFGGEVLYFDGARWQRVFQPAGDGPPNGAVAVWAGRSEAYFAPPRGPCDARGTSCIFHFRDGRSEAESLETASEVTSLVWIEGFGPLAGTKVGRILARRPKGGAVWNDLDPEAPYVAEAIDHVVAYGAGFMAFTRSWILVHDGLGFCPPVRPSFEGRTGSYRVLAGLDFGERVLLGGGQSEGRAALMWLAPR